MPIWPPSGVFCGGMPSSISARMMDRTFSSPINPFAIGAFGVVDVRIGQAKKAVKFTIFIDPAYAVFAQGRFLVAVGLFNIGAM